MHVFILDVQSMFLFFFCTEGRFCPLFYCLAEFINLVSSESNEVCSREEKRTIAPEHVLKALEVLTHPIDLSLIVLFVVVFYFFSC